MLMYRTTPCGCERNGRPNPTSATIDTHRPRPLEPAVQDDTVSEVAWLNPLISDAQPPNSAMVAMGTAMAKTIIRMPCITSVSETAR